MRDVRIDETVNGIFDILTARSERAVRQLV